MKKRILSLLLCLVMALSLLPTAAFAADGDPTIIDRLEFNFTTEHNYPGCLAYELTKELRNCLRSKYVGDGVHTGMAYCNNVYLYSWTGPNRTGTSVQIESGRTDLLDPSLYYYADFEFEAQEGYDFKHTGTTFDTSSLTCVINGDTSVAEVVSYYNEYWKSIDVYVPIAIDTTSQVRDVKITNTDVNVERGGTTQFTSDVLYYGAGYDAVNWSVEGANDANTTIDSAGLLTVAESETAEKITVKATAAMDPTKFDTKELSVIDKLYIDYVTLDAMYADIYLGAKRTFTATVEGTDAKDLDWSLTGGSSANTSCTVNGNKFTVNIGKDETASIMQLQVWAVKDPTKSAKVTITVLPLSNIERLEFNFTTDKAVEGTTAYELTKELRNCLWHKYVGDGMHTGMAKCSNVYLYSWTGPNRTGTSVQIESGHTDLLDPNLYYYADFEFEAQEGYDFKHTGTALDTSFLTCVINGDASVAEVVSVYNEYWKGMNVYVPIQIRSSVINSINITVDTPIVGKSAAESVFVPTVTTDPANAVEVNMAWTDWYNHGGNGEFTGIFQANTEYDYEICLMAKEGYRFPSVACDDMALANGAAVKYVDVSSNGELAYIGIVMTPTCTHAGTVVTDKAVAATYAKTGKTEGSHCSACGKVLTAQKTVAMKKLAQAKITSITNTSTGITVKWGKVTGATHYQVYRRVGSGEWKLWKTTTSTSVSNSGLTNGTKYQYKVRAVVKNSAGKVVNTGAFSAIKTMYRLTRPTLASGTKNIATRKIVVKWNKNTKVTGYQVKYIKGTTTKTVTVKGASSLTKTLSSLTKGSTYKVYVRSYKTVSGTNYYSAWSAYKSVKVAK